MNVYLAWSAALIALRARTQPAPPWIWIAAATLLWLALGAKEIALALPAILLAFELLPGRRQWPALLIATLLSATVLMGRIYGGAILDARQHHPSFTLSAYARSLSVMLGDLVCRYGAVSPTAGLGILAALALCAALLRTRAADQSPGSILDEQRVIAGVIDALPRSEVHARPGEGFLIVADPFQGRPWGEWRSAMLIQLHTGRRDLTVLYPYQPGRPAGLIPLAWVQGRFRRAAPVSGP